MFANATMHPKYSLLFFIDQNINDEKAKQSAFRAAEQAINALWQVVEKQLSDQEFLGGDEPSAADVLLAVYSRWGKSFPVNITLGANSEKMVETVLLRPSFQRALAAEEQHSAS